MGPEVHLCAIQRVASSTPMALGGLQARVVSSHRRRVKNVVVKGKWPRLLALLYSFAPHAGSDEEMMAHLLMYSTNYTVCVAPPHTR